MGQRGTIILITLIVLLVGGAGILAWQRMHRVTAESDPTVYWQRQGQIAYGKFDTVAGDDAEGIGLLLRNAPLSDPEGQIGGITVGTTQMRSLVAEFLLARLGATRASEYIESMASMGYRFMPREEFEIEYGPLADLADLAGVSSDDPRTVFEALWDYPPSRAAQIGSVCVGGDAAMVTIGHGTAQVWDTSKLTSGMGKDLWVGKSSARCRFWMRPPITREEVVERDGSVVTGIVSVIADVPGSARRPLHVLLFFEPQAQRFWIDGVSVTNHLGTDSAWTCMEF